MLSILYKTESQGYESLEVLSIGVLEENIENKKIWIKVENIEQHGQEAMVELTQLEIQTLIKVLEKGLRTIEVGRKFTEYYLIGFVKIISKFSNKQARITVNAFDDDLIVTVYLLYGADPYNRLRRYQINEVILVLKSLLAESIAD